MTDKNWLFSANTNCQKNQRTALSDESLR